MQAQQSVFCPTYAAHKECIIANSSQDHTSVTRLRIQPDIDVLRTLPPVNWSVEQQLSS
jgi:hypothetical protein